MFEVDVLDGLLRISGEMFEVAVLDGLLRISGAMSKGPELSFRGA
jgi:hypothetical protein